MNQHLILSIWFAVFLIFVLALIHSSLKLKGTGRLLFMLLQEKIEASLQGYRNRQRKEYSGHTTWACSGKRFDFFIHLQQRYWTARVSVWFHCETNRTFEMRFSGSRIKISGINNAYEKKLVAEKTFTAIWEERATFDRIVVEKDRIQTIKTYRRMTEVEQWPEALGGLITFVRYLLDFQSRKEVTTKGESLCPYCKEAIDDKQPTVSCRECKTVHHRECWEETGRCSIFGCNSKAKFLMRS